MCVLCDVYILSVCVVCTVDLSFVTGCYDSHWSSGKGKDTTELLLGSIAWNESSSGKLPLVAASFNLVLLSSSFDGFCLFILVSNH